MRRRQLETQRTAVEREPNHRVHKTQRREYEHRRCADRLAREPHPLESYRQRARVEQLHRVTLAIRRVGYPLGQAHRVRLAKRKRDICRAERRAGERPFAGGAGTSDRVPLHLRSELDRVDQSPVTVKKPNAFAIGVQLETEFAVQHVVRPGLEL